MTRSAGTVTVDEARALFDSWRDGDSSAFDQLVRVLTPMLWHLARAYRIDAQSAEDAVQATWFALVRRADSISDPQALVRWLSVTVRREAARLAKGAARTEPTESMDIDVRLPLVSAPDANVVDTAMYDVLWRHVSKLNERCQHLLRVLAFSERPDYKRLSADLKMPIGSIGPTRARCLNKLREACLADPHWSRP
ncbi:MAG: RNA polymerase sigma factor [Actinomycetales bacterium]